MKPTGFESANSEPPAEIIVTPEARYRYYSRVKFDERFSSMLL
jgi:hypothetical protein